MSKYKEKLASLHPFTLTAVFLPRFHLIYLSIVCYHPPTNPLSLTCHNADVILVAPVAGRSLREARTGRTERVMLGRTGRRRATVDAGQRRTPAQPGTAPRVVPRGTTERDCREWMQFVWRCLFIGFKINLALDHHRHRHHHHEDWDTVSVDKMATGKDGCDRTAICDRIFCGIPFRRFYGKARDKWHTWRVTGLLLDYELVVWCFFSSSKNYTRWSVLSFFAKRLTKYTHRGRYMWRVLQSCAQVLWETSDKWLTWRKSVFVE